MPGAVTLKIMEEDASIYKLPTSKSEMGKYEKFMNVIVSARDAPFVWVSQNGKKSSLFLWALLFLLYNAYLVGCILRFNESNQSEWEWCDGIGFLIIITSIVYFGLLYFLILKPVLSKPLDRLIFGPLSKHIDFKKFMKEKNQFAFQTKQLVTLKSRCHSCSL